MGFRDGDVIGDYAVIGRLDALGYAHERGVAHRDIKPSNIMVTPERVVKLMDFGIASKADERRLTRSGMALGSIYYMSPEQVSAKAVDGRSDLYSVGVTLYQLVTGRLPFDGDSEYAIMTGHLQQVPVPPLHHNPRLPPVLSDIVLCALEKDPARRFPFAGEFRDALRSVLGGDVAGHAGPPDPPARDVRTPSTPAAVRPGGSRLSTPSAGTPPVAPAVPDLEAVRKQLAAYIGPIAGVLVTRAARKAPTLDELCQTLAREIPAPADRERFLRSVLGSGR